MGRSKNAAALLFENSQNYVIMTLKIGTKCYHTPSLLTTSVPQPEQNWHLIQSYSEKNTTLETMIIW
ncbi:hypothetical protein GVAV_001145 [Gurleya vavrai]